MTENDIAKEIVDAAFRIHTTLGPGLLESVDDAVLAHELGRRGLRTARQLPIPVIYDSVRIGIGFRADLIVEDLSVVEIKSVEVLAPVHKKQLLTYLRLADKRLGLPINWIFVSLHAATIWWAPKRMRRSRGRSQKSDGLPYGLRLRRAADGVTTS